MAYPVRPPLEPMLGHLEDDIPQEPGWRYEPKWDGFRAIVFRDGDDLHVQSRGRKPLHRYFPELLPVLLEGLPRRCVVDGEIVIAGPDGLDFDALLQRIHPAASRIRLLSEQTPATYMAFDLIADGRTDLRKRPLSERRKRLEAAIPQAKPRGPRGSQRAERARSVGWGEASLLEPGPRLAMTPHTDDPEEAVRWMKHYEGVGLDGIVAKPEDLTYRPGERVMVKVKHIRTADCVVGGFRLAKDGKGVGSLLLGLYDEAGVLYHVGFTSSFRAPQRREILEKIRPLKGKNPFGPGGGPGGPTRWRAEEPPWVPLEPRLVCEVAFDHVTARRFRHGTRFLRWRTDRKPKDCTLGQMLPGRG